MDQLGLIPTLSIAELRKILVDNDIQNTSSSKEELIQQVSDTLLTKIMLDQLQEESNKELMEAKAVSKSLEQSRVDTKLEDDRRLRKQQDLDYVETVQIDTCVVAPPVEGTSVEGTSVEETVSLSGNLSPASLRAARLQYYE